MTSDREWRSAARLMEERGVVLIAAPPTWQSEREFWFPTDWPRTNSHNGALARWRPGWMLGALTGSAFDVIDVDPRNGGAATLSSFEHLLPPIAGMVSTPGGGQHLYVAASRQGGAHIGGIDYLSVGQLVYLPGTSRPKYNGAGYHWVRPLDWAILAQGQDDRFLDGLRELKPTPPTSGSNEAVSRVSAVSWVPAVSCLPPGAEGATANTAYGRAVLRAEADDVATRDHDRNTGLNLAAYRCGQLVHAGHLTVQRVRLHLLDAAWECGLERDIGHRACLATINSGLAAGLASPRVGDHGG